MKTAGIILLVLGGLSLIGGFVGMAAGKDPNFTGLAFIVLGAFLISRGNKKKEEEQEKKDWIEGKSE